MIQFESVSKTFRDGTRAVDDLSLTVPSGQITVIVGPSGCGKTTTLRMVNRMLEPTKGKVTWDGKPIKSRRKTALRRQMGYVIQSGGLFPHRTVLENIATVPDLQRWDKQKSRKRALELLGSVGLDRTLGNRYPAQLSGGQQQRVGVARALAADPLVLLMDEPFSAVDPVVRGELHEFFLGLQRELSKTIIMITHDIDEAIKLGDRVAILRVGGRLAQVGTPQQLLDEPADSFVEGFVGRDRGYRSLSFQPASGLSLGGVQVVREAGYTGGGDPVLVVDGDARPVGWSDPSRPGSMLALGATFDAETDSLRMALDAALTSPVGLAVAVSGESRRYAGVVDADMILRQVTQTRAQIAESIAVRAHDQEQPVTHPVPEPVSAVPSTGEPATDRPDDGPSGADDLDATSVRGVPPVAAVGSVNAVAAAGAAGVVAAQSADEDPDATRISGPLPDHGEADSDPDATRISGPLAQEGLAQTSPAQEDQPGAAPEPGPWSDPAGPSDQNTSFDDAPPTGEPQAEYPGDQPTDPSVSDQPDGSEVPPVSDESYDTAYDQQLAQDDDGWSDRGAVVAEDEQTAEGHDPYGTDRMGASGGDADGPVQSDAPPTDAPPTGDHQPYADAPSDVDTRSDDARPADEGQPDDMAPPAWPDQTRWPR